MQSIDGNGHDVRIAYGARINIAVPEMSSGEARIRDYKLGDLRPRPFEVYRIESDLGAGLQAMRMWFRGVNPESLASKLLQSEPDPITIHSDQ